jgi:hypothetical protein
MRTFPAKQTPAQQTFPMKDGAARARLDPTASPEVSAEYPLEPSSSVPFGVAFAQSRRRAFLAGCGAGAGGAFVLVGVVTLVGWLSGPPSENRVTSAPSTQIASQTEPASAPLPAAHPKGGGDRAAREVARRAKQAPKVVAAPVLVEKVAASLPAAVDREAAASAGGEEGRALPATADRSESKPLAKTENGEASDGPVAQTTEEQGPAVDERAAAATEAPAPAAESSGAQDRIALVPAVEPEQTPASDDAPGAPAKADPAQ